MNRSRVWVWRVFVFLSVFGFVGRSFVTVAEAQTVLTPPVGVVDDCKFVPAASTSSSVSGLSSISWPGTGGGAQISGAKCQTIALNITFSVMPTGGDLMNWNYVPGGCGGYDMQKIMVSDGRLLAGGGVFSCGCCPNTQNYQDIGPAVSGTRIQVDPFQGRIRNCAPASIAELNSGWKGIPQPQGLMTFVGSQATQIDTSRSRFGYWTGSGGTPINGDGSYVFSDASGSCSTSQPAPDPLAPQSPPDACSVTPTGGSTTVINLKSVAWSPSGSASLGGAKCQIVALDLTLPIVPGGGDLMTWNYVPSGCGSYYLQKLMVSGGRLYVGGGVFNSGCGASPQSYEDVGPAVPGMRIQFDPFQGRVRDCAPVSATEPAGPWRGLQQPFSALSFTGSQATRIEMSRSRFDFWTGSTATPINGDGSYVFSNVAGACSTSQPAPDPVAPASPVDGCTLNATGGSTTVNNLRSIAWSPSGSATITGAKCQILALDLTFPVAPGGGDIMTWNYTPSGCGSYYLQKLTVSGGRLLVGGGVFDCGCCPNSQSYQDVGPAVSGMRIQFDPFRGQVRHCSPTSLTELTGPWRGFQQPSGTLLFNGSQATRIDMSRSKFDFWNGTTTTPINGNGAYEFSSSAGACGENQVIPPIQGPVGPADGCQFNAAGGGTTVDGLRSLAWSPGGYATLTGAKCQLKAYDLTFEVMPTGGDISQLNYVGSGCGSYYLTKMVVSGGRLYVGGGVFNCGCCPSTQNYQDVGPAVDRMRIQIDPYRGLVRDCAPPTPDSIEAGPWRGIGGANPFMWFTGSQAMRVDMRKSIFGYYTGPGGTPISGDGEITYSNPDGSCADPFVTGSVVTTTTTTTPTTTTTTTPTTTTVPEVTTTTTTTPVTTTTVPTVLTGALTASIVRGVNNAAGASVYTVTLKVAGAVTGGQYEFVVPSGHVPVPLPPNPATQRYPKTAVNGEVVWQYTLVAPRGVYRAQVFAAGGTTALSTVEVK
jgi:hypothetical protein